MKRTVLLVRVETDRDLYFPLGLMYLSDALQKAGYSVKILHGYPSIKKQVRQAVHELNPLFVGFSVTTGNHLKATLDISSKVHDLKYPVVWGGVHATVLPEVCLTEPFVDAAVIGEGEETVVELARQIEEENGFRAERIAAIPGTAVNINGHVHYAPPRGLIGDLDLYRPRYEDVDIHKYFMPVGGNSQGLQITTSRGCPYDCGFCCVSTIYQRKVRKHSVEYSRDLMDHLVDRYGMDGIVFHDDLFFSSVPRVKSIMQGYSLPWWGELRANQVTDDLADWLRKRNCKTLFIGAESGSQRLLDHINKKIKADDLLQAAKILSRKQIKSEFSFIQGLPGETAADRHQTYKMIDSIDRLGRYTSCGLKLYTPYPGTPLWKEAVSSGFHVPVSNEEWSLVDRRHTELPWLTDEDHTAVQVRHFLTISPNQSNPSSRKEQPKSLFSTLRIFYRMVMNPFRMFEYRWLLARWQRREFRFPFDVHMLFRIHDTAGSWTASLRNWMKRILLHK